MKIVILTMILYTNLIARLGESVQQCQDRYGYPTSENEISEDYIARHYFKNEIDISITFFKDIAIKIMYSKPLDDFINYPPIEPQEIKTLLNAN